MTKERIEEAIEIFSHEEIVTLDFRKLPKEFRATVVQFFKELKSKKGVVGENTNNGNKTNGKNERNPDTCYGSGNGNVCDCCDDKCVNNPNQHS